MASDPRFAANHAGVEHRAEMLAVIPPIMTGKAPLPIGPLVPPTEPRTPSRAPLTGTHVHLRPIDPPSHTAPLFACSHGSLEHDALWTYLPYGPFPDAATMQAWLVERAVSHDPMWFTVVDRSSETPIGMVSFMNIVPEMRRLELGHIWYGPQAQRTKINTETIYLMLRRTFNELEYRRAEWKCDALNARSRAAALRLGFRFEGIFRQHLIYKGRNRDTAWFSMMDHEWPRIKTNMERWLAAENPGLSLAALNRA
ncbi:MAG TPA: GNAT family protein [Anaerolineales bacterium]|nr:GNAT family protein [Anaerolineales bacterium]